jgi:hypothetical protein
MSVISSRRAWRQPQAALSAACLSMVVALAIPGYRADRYIKEEHYRTTGDFHDATRDCAS